MGNETNTAKATAKDPAIDEVKKAEARAKQSANAKANSEAATAGCTIIAQMVKDKEPELKMAEVIGRQISSQVSDSLKEAGKKAERKNFRIVTDLVLQKVNNKAFETLFLDESEKLEAAVKTSHPEVVAAVFRWFDAESNKKVLAIQEEIAKANDLLPEDAEPEKTVEPIYELAKKPIVALYKAVGKGYGIANKVHDDTVAKCVKVYLGDMLTENRRKELLEGLKRLCKAVKAAASGGGRTKGGTLMLEYAEVGLSLAESKGQKSTRIVEDAIKSKYLKASD